MGKLRDQMTQDLAVRDFSKNTQDVYLHAAKSLAKFYMRSPVDLDARAITSYLEFLKEIGRAPSTRAVHASGLKFLYRVTLDKPEIADRIPIPKVPKVKPPILTGSEIETLYEGMPSVKHRAAFLTTYACGLRASEMCSLRIEDIDSARGRILIRNAKGHKDRYVSLGARLLEELRGYYRHARPAGPYLFAGRNARHPMTRQSFNQALRQASNRLGFSPHVKPHDLRHAYATHMLELGIDLRVLSMLLGHSDPRSTEHYVSLTERVFRNLPNPADLLGSASSESKSLR